MDKVLGIAVLIAVPLAMLLAAIAIALAPRWRWPSVLGLVAVLAAATWVVRVAVRNRLWYQAPAWPIALAATAILLTTAVVVLWRDLGPVPATVSGVDTPRRRGWTIVSVVAADISYVITLGVLSISPSG